MYINLWKPQKIPRVCYYSRVCDEGECPVNLENCLEFRRLEYIVRGQIVVSRKIKTILRGEPLDRSILRNTYTQNLLSLL